MIAVSEASAAAVTALAPYGADERVGALFSTYAPGLVPGRVARVDRIRALVAIADGIVSATAEALPVVGDWVGLAPLDPGADATTVEAVLPRWSELSRRASGPVPEAQVVAANVDLVFVVSTLDRPLSPNRIERELVVGWESGGRPVVVLNKADASIAAPAEIAALRDRLGLVDVVVTSAATGEGVAELAAALAPSRTAVMLGASGVGKSSLVNALVGSDVADTGAVREDDRRGRHTTTARWLLTVPGGGVLLDTPGIRSIGLWDAEDGIAKTFPEIDELAAACRFRDCRHEDEPGCAVLAAVAAGTLAAARFDSWQKLQRELAYEARAVDPQLQAEERRKWKTIQKSLKDHPKSR
jgi:ribosome biogenesis GTPase